MTDFLVSVQNFLIPRLDDPAEWMLLKITVYAFIGCILYGIYQVIKGR